MRTHATTKALCAAALCLAILGCATPYFQDRRRAIVYVPPASFHPYSADLLDQLRYERRWTLPLAGCVNVDPASVRTTLVTDDSLVLSLKEGPITGTRATHFLLTGIHAAAPVVVSRSFPGSILPVHGGIYAVEETTTGFTLTALDERLQPADVRKITCYKYKHAEKNLLDSNSTGVFHEEDNVSAYFYAAPWVVFSSVNYSTDKNYVSTRYQSQAVSKNTVQFICVNLETGDTIRTGEVDFGPYYKQNSNAALPGVLTPSASAFFPIEGQNAFAFKLTNAANDSYNCYITGEPGTDASIYVDTAENIVKRFPSLTLTTNRSMAETAEVRILRQAMNGGGTVNLAGEDHAVIGFEGIPDHGFLVFTREKQRDGSPCAVFYTDLGLQNVRWRHDFAKGLTVSSGSVNAEADNVMLLDADSSGRGYIFVKVLDTGHESRLVPVNIVQDGARAVAAGYAFAGGGLLLYDDKACSLVYAVQRQ
jgi:hypothetical protein